MLRFRGEIENVEMVYGFIQIWVSSLFCIFLFYIFSVLLRIVFLVFLFLQIQKIWMQIIWCGWSLFYFILYFILRFCVILLFVLFLMNQCWFLRCLYMVLYSIFGDEMLIEVFKYCFIKFLYFRYFKGLEKKGQFFK